METRNLDEAFIASDPQKLFQMFERLVRQYRRGGNIYVLADEISIEWEKQNLPCAIEKHIKQHNLDHFIK